MPRIPITMYTRFTMHPAYDVPLDFGGPGMTPHSKSQLAMVDERRGWRRLDDEKDQSSTIVYVVCHPQDGYSRTIYSPYGRVNVTQQQFGEAFTERLSEVEVPPKWAEEMADAYGDSGAMEGIVSRINETYPSGRTGNSEVVNHE